MDSPLLQVHLDPPGKVLDDPPTFFHGIALIADVSAAFRSEIVWRLLPSCHTCGWSVGLGNIVTMSIIRLRCEGGTILLELLEIPNEPSSSTKCCPEFPKHLDISLGVDCHRPLVVVLEPEWSNDAMFKDGDVIVC